MVLTLNAFNYFTSYLPIVDNKSEDYFIKYEIAYLCIKIRWILQSVHLILKSILA